MGRAEILLTAAFHIRCHYKIVAKSRFVCHSGNDNIVPVPPYSARLSCKVKLHENSQEYWKALLEPIISKEFAAVIFVVSAFCSFAAQAAEKSKPASTESA